MRDTVKGRLSLICGQYWRAVVGAALIVREMVHRIKTRLGQAAK